MKKYNIEILFKNGNKVCFEGDLISAKKVRDVLKGSWRRLITFESMGEYCSITIDKREVICINIKP